MDRLYPKETLSEDILIHYRRHDPIGLGYVYTELHPGLSAFIAYKIQNNIENEDIASESIEEAWLLNAPHDDVESLKKYFYGVAANKCKDYRTARGWPAELSEDLTNPIPIDPAIVARRAAKAHEAMGYIRKRKGLARAIGEKALIEGQENRKVGEDLNIPNKKVANVKYKLITWLREKINFKKP